MQTIQFKVDDNYLNIILTLLNSLKKDMVRELKIIKNSKVTNSSLLKSEEQIKLDRVKGILKNRISDPIRKIEESKHFLLIRREISSNGFVGCFPMKTPSDKNQHKTDI